MQYTAGAEKYKRAQLVERDRKEISMRKHVLYVGGLSQATKDESAGYGFVEMGSPAQALHAVVELDGSLFYDGCLEVYATPSGVHKTSERGRYSDRNNVQHLKLSPVRHSIHGRVVD